MNTIPVSIPSKNYGRTRSLKRVTLIVLHTTGSARAASAVNWFKNPSSKVSAHYVVDTDGTVYKCVPTSNAAYHAGVSKGPAGNNVNTYSVGIEIAHIDGKANPYPKAQVDAVTELCETLRDSLPIKWITEHRQIAPKRKVDPMGYPTEELAEHLGLVFWKAGDKV